MRHCSFTSVLCDISVLSFCFPACFRASCVLNSSLVYSLCLLLLLPFSFLIYLNTLFFICRYYYCRTLSGKRWVVFLTSVAIS